MFQQKNNNLANPIVMLLWCDATPHHNYTALPSVPNIPKMIMGRDDAQCTGVRVSHLAPGTRTSVSQLISCVIQPYSLSLDESINTTNRKQRPIPGNTLDY